MNLDELDGATRELVAQVVRRSVDDVSLDATRAGRPSPVAIRVASDVTSGLSDVELRRVALGLQRAGLVV